MKPAVSATIILLLALGAILYSYGSVLGMTQDRLSDNSGFGPNPLMAGARAAKPNGVPTCLTMCKPHGDQAAEANESGDHDQNKAAGHDTGTTAQTTTSRSHATANSHAAGNHTASSAHAVAASNTKAVAVAKSSASVTVHPTTKTIVEQPQTTIVQHEQVLAASTAQPVQTVTTIQPQRVIVQRPVMLPATGTALNTGLGTGAIALAGYLYLRARRSTPPKPGAKPIS